MSGKAVDFANYTAVPTAEQVRCLLSQGYTKAIIGTSYGDVWRAQIAACESAGMDVEEYLFPNALRAPVIEHPWWLDCETRAATVEGLRTIIPVHKPAGIYTRRNWWTSETGDWHAVDEFPWLKLWDASYGDPPPAFVPYGGWTKRAMHQWRSSTLLCGLNVDVNIIEEDIVDTYTKAEVDAKIAAVLKAIGDLGAKVDAAIAAQKAAAAALGGKP